MNVLIATTRQYHPEHEWNFQGLRNLFETKFNAPINWAVYDSNPDLRNENTPQTHRLRLQSNSFHHQSLMPFSAVVVLGPDPWRGYATEMLYGVLAKRPLPLLLLDAHGPARPLKLSSDEKTCFSRENTRIATRDPQAQEFFRRYGIPTSDVLSPLFYAVKETEKSTSTATAFVLETTNSLGQTVSEDLVRDLLAEAARHPKSPIICLTLNDFMRFSTMFPDRCRYSCDASDYASFLKDVGAVVTTSVRTAKWASGQLRKAIVVVDRKTTAFEEPAFFQTIVASELAATVDKVKQVISSSLTLNERKTNGRQEWNRLLSILDSNHPGNQRHELSHATL